MTTSTPCPWCGKTDGRTVHVGGRGWHQHCRSCGAQGPVEASAEAAIAAWGQRPSLDREVVEAVSKDVYAIANKLARFGDENGVATGELVDELNELGTRIRAIAPARETIP